ncbi:GPI ethanolamine phosphate transferase 1 isoform X2 [Orussus abietinus]|uniref:GPI ethanolamine phosphate transferase 1 isoform X2 n=1 Tax=Orussus abietinus TaxID=222816 RepID=UPI000625491A|nr:GPI ethanolamine phosphate transferase 1 isoform X2 [Orussus abietinus]
MQVKVINAESRNRSTNGFFLGLGLLMHLIILWGVLDANFHSPILQGLAPIPVPKPGPAKRLFLFVADGLRYRTFKENPPPYLRKVMENQGSWGVSHTRMPTESRPGNVAIVAGLYEDPSALFKGWKEYPIDFDSVFNRSRQTWAWGSPDIVPMFANGNKLKVHGESYSPDWQDFGARSGSNIRLDSWVFDKFFQWLGEKAENVKNHNEIIIFFHLLGCDTTGHANKPYSKEYIENMQYVDQEIKRVVHETESFFDQGTTAYIFTSDHGMTNWGSHGSGSTDETETPIIAWGAGVNKLNSRQDVEQADIAPLISALLGIPIPVNSEGILPKQYLSSGNEEYGARVLLSNVKQLMQQVTANRISTVGNSIPQDDHREANLYGMISDMERLIQKGKLVESIEEGQRATLQAKESLYFYRKYQRDQLIAYLALIWLGWLTLLVFEVIGIRRKNAKTAALILSNIGCVSALFVLLLKYKGYSNWRLPGYGSIAIFSLWLASRSALNLTLAFEEEAHLLTCLTGIVFLMGMMFLGLTHRWVFGVGMLAVTAIQRILLKEKNPVLVLTGIWLASFPVLPVVEPHPRIYVVFTSLAVAAISLAFNKFVNTPLKAVEIVRIGVTTLVLTGYIDGRSWVSWIILFTTPLGIWLYPSKIDNRIMGIVYELLCPLILLSASYEPLFYLVLAAHLLSWPFPTLTTEWMCKKHLLRIRDLTKASFFMMYILLCFFGTGNMASISSFDPLWTRHFVTIFSPFTMGFLILLKFSIPLILVSCAIRRTFHSSEIFLAILLLGDCLALPLMFGVTSQGSWLDIGSAISRFTIAITLPLLLLVFYYLSKPLITLSITRQLLLYVRREHTN